MPVRQAIQTIRRLIGAPFWRGRSRELRGAVAGTELARVNAVAGKEPVRPELSGLRVRRPDVPRRMVRVIIQVAYRWQPSGDYRRREQEIRELNEWLVRRRNEGGRAGQHLPPIFTFVEDTDVAPTRLHPLLEGRAAEGSLPPLLPMDLKGLESGIHVRVPPMLHPRLPETNPDDLVLYRPLFPRRLRLFLRSSPYPRLAAVALTALSVILSISWVDQVQRAEAVAAKRFHVTRHAFRSALDSARVYGVDAPALQWLARQERRLQARSAPSGFVVTRARVRFYQAQERRYAALLHTVRALERRALRYWTWMEGVTYASLMEATQQIRDLGVPAALPLLPACRTPRCLRSAVAGQAPRTAWLQETAATLRIYAAQIRTSTDPVSAAGLEVQTARALGALLPASTPVPARIAELDGRYAAATGVGEDARIGALAHLDADVLHAAVVRTLPGRAVLVSVEDERLTCYQRGRDVYHTPIMAGPTAPTGIFHIQAKQASIPTLYWNQRGDALRYRPGALLFWMPFSGDAALQAAPWRSVFGPGSDAVRPVYAPSTPGSIDLPPTAARHVFGWVATGTEIVVY